MSMHFIGVDAGGTQTRALVADGTGRIIGLGHASGANTWSSGTSASRAITTAIGAALARGDPASIVGGVIGVAGGGATDPEVAAEITEGWLSLGLAGAPLLVPDVVAVYAAGTTAPHGLVLAAGTGSIAAVIEGGRLRRRSGGHGWLVGDEGSAVWLGIKGITAALRALDRRGPQTILATTIPAALDIDEPDKESTTARLVVAAHGRPPAQLGRLAPLVVEACELDDPVARALIEAAADHLTDLAVAVMGEEKPPAIVLAGSLLTDAAPISRRVRTRLEQLWPAAPTTETNSGEAGAVALAIARHTGTAVTDITLAHLQRGDPARRRS